MDVGFFFFNLFWSFSLLPGMRQIKDPVENLWSFTERILASRLASTSCDSFCTLPSPIKPLFYALLRSWNGGDKKIMIHVRGIWLHSFCFSLMITLGYSMPWYKRRRRRRRNLSTNKGTNQSHTVISRLRFVAANADVKVIVLLALSSLIGLGPVLNAKLFRLTEAQPIKSGLEKLTLNSDGEILISQCDFILIFIFPFLLFAFRYIKLLCHGEGKEKKNHIKKIWLCLMLAIIYKESILWQWFMRQVGFKINKNRIISVGLFLCESWQLGTIMCIPPYVVPFYRLTDWLYICRFTWMYTCT